MVIKKSGTKTVPLTKNVGGKTVGSVQFPITKSVAIIDVVNYFKSGKGKGLGVKKVTDASTGASYPVV
ncbi:MAG: hypothetical protein HC930_01240 [Hydrococcus sp. SU_1_0]|nr:hypothetical protein [Hydrococcus sp. SU_1_0]